MSKDTTSSASRSAEAFASETKMSADMTHAEQFVREAMRLHKA